MLTRCPHCGMPLDTDQDQDPGDPNEGMPGEDMNESPMSFKSAAQAAGKFKKHAKK